MDVIHVGNTYEPQQMGTQGTAAQRRVIFDIISAPGFDFACMNPYPLGESYDGKRLFTYYTVDGVFNAVRIAKDGRILYRAAAR